MAGRITGSIIAALLVATIAGLAQRRYRFEEPEEEGPRPAFPTRAEFHFIRVEYTDLPQYHRRWGYASRGATGEGWWMVDWPDADEHFSMGVQRLTRFEPGDPRRFRRTDGQLFDYAWLCAT